MLYCQTSANMACGKAYGDVLTLLMQTVDVKYGRRQEGITQIHSAEWVSTSATSQHTGVHRVTACDMIAMLTYCINKAFLCNSGRVYQQIVGIPMGLHASPQIAQLVCANYA